MTYRRLNLAVFTLSVWLALHATLDLKVRTGVKTGLLATAIASLEAASGLRRRSGCTLLGNKIVFWRKLSEWHKQWSHRKSILMETQTLSRPC